MSLIYVQVAGKFARCGEPKTSPERRNFVITWKGLDWSGFRTLADCEKQFPELERRRPGESDYAVEER